MKYQPPFALVRWLLPLLGAAVLLLPILTQAAGTTVTPPAGSLTRPTGPVVPTSLGPDLKVDNVCAIIPGSQAVKCTVTVANIGNVASFAPMTIVATPTVNTSNVTFGGSGGSLMPNCSPGPGGSIQPSTCTANVSLAPSESKFVFFTFGFGQGGSLTHCATVTQATPPSPKMADRDPTNNTNICATVVVPAPPPPTGADLSVTNTCALDPGHGSQGVLCTVAVHNGSTNTYSGSPVTLTTIPTTPPAGTLYTSSSGGFVCTVVAGSVASMSCVYSNTITSGQTVSASLYFKVAQGGTFTNCASVTQGAWVDPSPANNTDQCASVSVPVPVAGVVMIAPSNVNFGTVNLGTATSLQTVTLSNHINSSGPLNITVPDLNPPFAVNPTGTFAIGQGQSKTFNLYFSPSQSGSFSPAWVISHNATNQQTPLVMPVQATALAPAVYMSTISNYLNFGNVKLGTPRAWRSVTLGNEANSSGNLIVTVPSLSPFSPFSVDPTGTFTIGPGLSKSFNLYFGPSQLGAFNEILWITSNAANSQNNVFQLNLQGSGCSFC